MSTSRRLLSLLIISTMLNLFLVTILLTRTSEGTTISIQPDYDGVRDFSFNDYNDKIVAHSVVYDALIIFKDRPIKISVKDPNNSSITELKDFSTKSVFHSQLEFNPTGKVTGITFTKYEKKS